MKTVEEIRRDWLNTLIASRGSIAALNEELGRTRTDATLSQIRNQAPDSKTGNPKNMGSPLAREIEERLELARGTLDNPPPAPYEENAKIKAFPLNERRHEYAAVRDLLALAAEMSPEGHTVLLYEAKKIAEQFPKAKANHAS